VIEKLDKLESVRPRKRVDQACSECSKHHRKCEPEPGKAKCKRCAKNDAECSFTKGAAVSSMSVRKSSSDWDQDKLHSPISPIHAPSGSLLSTARPRPATNPSYETQQSTLLANRFQDVAPGPAHYGRGQSAYMPQEYVQNVWNSPSAASPVAHGLPAAPSGQYHDMYAVNSRPPIGPPQHAQQWSQHEEASLSPGHGLRSAQMYSSPSPPFQAQHGYGHPDAPYHPQQGSRMAQSSRYPSTYAHITPSNPASGGNDNQYYERMN